MANKSKMQSILWMRKTWGLKENPYPSTGIACLGGADPRENGELFDESIMPEKFAEAEEKFVLGAAFGRTKFGYLWSLGTTGNADARGFAKSSVMQHLAKKVNADFGRSIIVNAGLSSADADEKPICAVVASFDMANTKSLHAVFFEATLYACTKKTDGATLAERLRRRLIEKIEDESTAQLIAAVEEEESNIDGRTMGPMITELVEHICFGDAKQLKSYFDKVKTSTRSRTGAMYLATLLIVAKAAGVDRVLLCCDQLEDLASTTTPRQKRALEVERFRDFVVELQPMASMLSCVVTLHPRATMAIGELWALADLPSYDHTRSENRNSVVVLGPIRTAARAGKLLETYLNEYRTTKAPADNPTYPFSKAAVEVIFARAEGKPRDVLKKARSLLDIGGAENWEEIDGDRASEALDGFSDDGENAPIAIVAKAGRSRSELWD